MKPNYNKETIEIKTDRTTNSSLVVMWQPISNLPREGQQYYRYRIEYWVTPDGNFQDIFVDHTDQTFLYHEITDLMFNTEYMVRVVPQRINGSSANWGRAYPQQTATTKCGCRYLYMSCRGPLDDFAIPNNIEI